MARTAEVNLYDYPIRGSLDLCIMIAHEVGCGYDASGWGTPFRFLLENEDQYPVLVDLVKCFDLKFVGVDAHHNN